MNIPLRKCSNCRPRHNFVVPRSFISNSLFNILAVFSISSGAPMMFISST
ncbi:hypothetical protein HanIR_Chr06g0265101 [Helianthus annuus]|nr:hypothetical protein HanIR_Chr06g0265101 [Helianthus annuus]